jgi:hypothetical protein
MRSLFTMRSRRPLVALLGSLSAAALTIAACSTDASPSATDTATGSVVAETATPDTAGPDVVAPGTADGADELVTATTGPDESQTGTSEAVTLDTAGTAVPIPIPRVLIDTDLGGGIPGDPESRGDPDDIQSLVRAVHYSDALDIEGIVSTEAPGTARPELIREWIRRTDVDHLRAQGYTDLMTEAELLAAVKTGTSDREGPGDGRSTEGSRHIIARAHAGSGDDPLWILAWGSLGTIAQALYDDPSIVPKIRMYSIGDYNARSNGAARDFVLDFLDDHPDLWWVENGVLPVQTRSTFEGVWRGGNQRGQWNRTTFLERNIRGHGTTAGGAFPEKLGDAFPVAIGPPEAVGALKEGDSPSLLYLLSPRFGDVGDLDDPTQPSWGGRFRRASPKYPNYYVDLNCATPERCQATINRYRVDFLSHWRDRWDRYDEPNDERGG